MNVSAGSQGVLSVLHLATASSAEHWKSEPVPLRSSGLTEMERRNLCGNSLH